jgi:NO-binding membrane sensor protein with MHYT domain
LLISWNISLVALSVLVAMIGSFTALTGVVAWIPVISDKLAKLKK